MTKTPPVELTATSSNCKRFPILAGVKLVQAIKWSATRLGPHYALSFNEFSKNELRLRSNNQLVIGSYHIERPFNEEVSDIVISLPDGVVAILPLNGAANLALATSLPQLSRGLIAFYELHECLSELKQRDSSAECWNKFEQRLSAIDPQALFDIYSYWGNMVEERKTMN